MVTPSSTGISPPDRPPHSQMALRRIPLSTKTGTAPKASGRLPDGREGFLTTSMTSACTTNPSL